MILKILKVVLVLLGITFSVSAQGLSEKDFKIFDRNGKPAVLIDVSNALANADVVFIGEQHDDATAHHLQFDIFKTAFEKYGKSRPILLSMEMFERDAQTVVDEYLQDIINEPNFISAARVWNNYKTDYRPLVEFAKTNKLPVIAANAPRRYVNLVSRKGREALNQLTPQAKTWLAPLPYAAASKEYAAKFAALMGGTMAHGLNLLDSQSLWDATMADSIARALNSNKNALVVHLNGGFHSENRLGAVEHLLKYNPKARVIVLTIKSADNFPNFDAAKDANAGDFVILTDPKLPRSFTR